MPTKPTRLRHLFECYTRGTITPEEERELMQYIAHPANRREIDEFMAELWENETETRALDPQTVDNILRTITSARRPPAWQRVYRMAAVFTCLALAGAALFYYGYGGRPTPDAIAHSVSALTASPKAMVLPDGSTVLLKEGSELMFPRSFEGELTRSVTLNGEGFFDIVPDPEKPFVVHTGALETRVLGTAFVIKAYEHDPRITVTVSRGKVQVSDKRQVIGTITKDQQITFDKQRSVAAQQDIRSDSTIAWTRQDIYFDDVTFSEAAARLSDRFGVKLQFADERIQPCRFTATFIEGESFLKILQVICAFNHARFSQTGPDEFVIDGPGC